MRRLLLPALVVVSLVGAGACGGDDDDGGSGTDATVAEVTSTTAGRAPSTPAGGPVADLVNAGAEPRSELRLALTAGTELTFTSSTTVDQTVNGASPGPITTTFTITTSVVAVDHGIARLTATYRDPDVDTTSQAGPEVVAAAQASAALLDGAVADLRVDDRGRIVDADFTPGTDPGALGSSLVDALLDNLTSEAIVLPDEPVGVGGQWVLRATSDVEGITTATQTTFTVTGIDAAGVDLTFTSTGTLSGAAEGTKTGSGTVRISFDSLLPDRDGTSANAMTAQGSEIEQDVTQSLHRA